MSIKILGGFARGLSLQTPKDDLIRPTSVMVRRKLFDWRQRLEGFAFVDLCAGTGAVGLEAFSRGADELWVSEPNRIVYKVLEGNIKLFANKYGDYFEQDIVCYQKPLDQFLKNFLSSYLSWEEEQKQKTILFLDPPYGKIEIYEEALKQLKEANYLGELWLESDELKGMKSTIAREHFSKILKIVEQGDHYVLVGLI
jgi:16S rRNA (guanine966-N2)-methyltransferase